MEKEPGEDKEFYVDDILAAPRNDDAMQADITDAQDVIKDLSAEEYSKYEKVIEMLGTAEFIVLSHFELTIPEAAALKDELLAGERESESSDSGLMELAVSYDQMIDENSSLDRIQTYKRKSAIAKSIYGLSFLKAQQLVEGTSYNPSLESLQFVESLINDARPVLNKEEAILLDGKITDIASIS